MPFNLTNTDLPTSIVFQIIIVTQKIIEYISNLKKASKVVSSSLNMFEFNDLYRPSYSFLFATCDFFYTLNLGYCLKDIENETPLERFTCKKIFIGVILKIDA